jgi:hypothetical protein
MFVKVWSSTLLFGRPIGLQASQGRTNHGRLGGHDRTTTEDLVVNFGLCRNHRAFCPARRPAKLD